MAETFVLITGACHGGWTWRLVAQHLRAAGHRVLAPTLPGLADGDHPERYSLAEVSDFIVDLVEGADLSDVTLVGHSWGGYPLTGAAHRLAPRLRKLVYWGAFVPAEDTPLLEEVPPHYAEMFTQLAAASGNNSIVFPYEVFCAAFMQDADESTQRLIHSLLVPQPMRYFTETVTPVDPAALGLPASYVIGSEDFALPPGDLGWTPRFPQRLGAGTPVIEHPGSHEAQFTRPAELAAALLKA
ncbi:pimeloyl-ACP methyl ester carboxylesterase [Nonomuraea polychroma]|uniref:Pimeloyl-ACP methyl ester carboxylesterase n=1 Tax=Nonomuraea polychroma TaxID=46176 RepID=A0A438LYG9_9ACTN|nr:alpha/beta fold hydrolase [Nonomuraea polychroma]RVX38511.1 pimeloyl-ACP methyl ester carboxylesterase [Nonomuraea polychroma]